MQAPQRAKRPKVDPCAVRENPCARVHGLCQRKRVPRRMGSYAQQTAPPARGKFNLGMGERSVFQNPKSALEEPLQPGCCRLAPGAARIQTEAIRSDRYR